MTEIAKPGEEQERIVREPPQELPAPPAEPEPVEVPEREEVEAYFCASNYCDDPVCTTEHLEVL